MVGRRLKRFLFVLASSFVLAAAAIAIARPCLRVWYQVEDIPEYCLICGVVVFDEGVLQLDDNSQAYINSDRGKIFIPLEQNVSSCDGELVMFDGTMKQDLLQSAPYLSHVSLISVLTNSGGAPRFTCFVTAEEFEPVN